ncbi:unnamed protein product [Hapterophycus canaliculatus]
MSGRARVPLGAAERPGIFGNPTSGRAAPSSEADFLSKTEDVRRDDVPRAVSRQQQQQQQQQQGRAGSSSSTPYGALSPGRRRAFSSPYNGNPIAPGRAEYGHTAQNGREGSKPANQDELQESSRYTEISESVGEANKRGPGDEQDMLELEHIIGYTGRFNQTVLAHPGGNGVMIKSVGALLVIGSIADPHQQYLLRGHDMEISALAVSPSGSLIATGQRGSTRVKGYPAPVFLWDYATRTSLFVFQGLTEDVRHLSFSPDQKFLLGCGGDRLVYVWDTSTGELVTGKQYPEPSSLGEWTAVKLSGRRPVYEICLCIGADFFALELNFDPSRRQWTISGGAMATPSSGLRRSYNCSALLPGGEFLLCGTDVGDMVVFGVGARVFRASVPISSGGMLAICSDHATGVVYCGGGNGVIRKIVGADMVWQQEMETKLDGGVVSLSIIADTCELLAGTQEGSVYRLLLADLSASKVSSSQKSPVLSVACGSRCDAFATCAQDGTVRVWDLCDFGVVVEASERPQGAAYGARSQCLCWLGEEAVVTGWSDCSVRCHDAATGALRWAIPKAHRAPITCCAVSFDSSASFLVTGAEDGSVSVWELRTRELLLRFSEHQKGVRSVLVDVASPNLVHSAGADCTLFTYDLRKERRTVAHMTRAGAFQSMTQRKDSENELITCDLHGRLLTWDCDYRDPVQQAMQDPSKQCLSCVNVSPSGRYMALGGDDETVKVLDLANDCETVACGQAHAGAITSIQWTGDERQLISAADDCTLAIWNFFGSSGPSPSGRSDLQDVRSQGGG